MIPYVNLNMAEWIARGPYLAGLGLFNGIILCISDAITAQWGIVRFYFLIAAAKFSADQTDYKRFTTIYRLHFHLELIVLYNNHGWSKISTEMDFF